MGSYDNQMLLKAPDWSRHEFLGIDICIAVEVWDLWQKGIITTGCCCGHNIAPAYIGVEFEFIPMMKDMGYEVLSNTIRPDDEDSFYPLSIDCDWIGNKVKCDLCAHEWWAVYIKSISKLECPHCKNMTQFELLSKQSPKTK